MQPKQLDEVLAKAISQALANTHTATIARVTAVGSKTISCQPVINRVVKGQSVRLPEFVDVPPVFLGGGSSSLSFPIAVGDYALLIFTERCFDRWWTGSDFQRPLELRMHDYSDGLAIVGLKPEASALAIPESITIVGDVEMTGSVDISGALDVSGAVSAGNGATGAFVSQDGKAVTVTNGIVTQII